MNPILERLPFPTALAFEPIQLCNASCFCCPYSWLKEDDSYRGNRMTRAQITQLIEAFASVRQTHNYQGPLTINPFRFSDPLVCPDLDVIFALAETHDLKVVVTTNGVGLNSETIALLNRYRERMNKISISFIGCTDAEIKQYMGLNFSKVLLNLDEVANHWPDLCGLFRVTLRVIKDTDEERETLAALQERFVSKGISVKAIHELWMTNRIDAGDFVIGQKPQILPPQPQTKKRFVAGCGWAGNLVKRLEVMTDGSVVLCCDDAEKHKVFGNVFEQSIDEIWSGKLRAEHELVLGEHFSKTKSQLICSNCTRAIWSDAKPTREDMLHRSVVNAA